MRNMKLKVFALMMVVALASCNKDNETDEQEHNPLPEVITDKTTDTVSANLEVLPQNVGDDFTFNIVKQLNTAQKDNFLLSPISVQLAFAMLTNGADGNTRQQLLSALGYGSKSIDELNSDCQKVIEGWKKLNSDYANWNEGSEGRYQQTIETANAIWTDKRFPLFEEYIGLCNKYFDAEAATLDFSDKTNTLATMNGWCNQKTHGMIPSMLDDISPETITILANALYFKGNWATPFTDYLTVKTDFTNADGAVTKVDMMHQQEFFYYVRAEKFAMAELPYNGSSCMDIILPDNGVSINQCISELSLARFDTAREKMIRRNLYVSLPKFDLNFNHNLVDIMKQLGAVDVFDSGVADLSKMGSHHDGAFVSDAFQLSRISVDESGTEASAVTVIEIAESAWIPEETTPIEFNVNRPFAYVIRDRQSGTILFVGKVVKLN